jgi:hypothetical protein
VVPYKATEKVPIASELVITSDDPTTPVKTLDVMAYTIVRVKPTTAAATKTTRTIDRSLITMGDRVRWLQPVVDPRTFAFLCWATPVAPRPPAAGQPLRSGSR